jgi:uncharacterized protein (DUF4415 family)
MQMSPLTHEEVARLAKELYESSIRDRVETDENIGKMIIIDIATGNYAIEEKAHNAVHLLRSQNPGARLFGIRIGYNVAVAFGGGLMKRIGSAPPSSETDWERVLTMSDEDIDLSEIPEATAEQVARATFRIGRVPMERKQESVQLMIDGFVLDYFKAKAGDRDYRSLVNAALTEYMMGNPLSEETVS